MRDEGTWDQLIKEAEAAIYIAFSLAGGITQPYAIDLYQLELMEIIGALFSKRRGWNAAGNEKGLYGKWKKLGALNR